MKRVLSIFAVCGFVWGVGAVRGAPDATRDASADLHTLDALVGRWVALRTTLATEKREWDERRVQWEQEIALLEQEAELLKHMREEGDAFASALEIKRTDTQARRERMEAEFRTLRALLDRAEVHLRSWQARIPPGLMASTMFDALPGTPNEAGNLSLMKRAQTVVVLYTQIETIQNQFHATREVLNVEGTRRQTDVLYVGLARAFAVAPDNQWAAVGRPSETGWTWTPSMEDAPTIRRALDVLNRRETAQFLMLPLQVVGEVEP